MLWMSIFIPYLLWVASVAKLVLSCGELESEVSETNGPADGFHVIMMY